MKTRLPVCALMLFAMLSFLLSFSFPASAADYPKEPDHQDRRGEDGPRDLSP